MKFNFPINNFSAGEWSPKMSSRTDTAEYARSCEEITNFNVQMQGGAQYRGNTLRFNFDDLGVYAPDLSMLLVDTQPTAKAKLVPYRSSLVGARGTLMFYPYTVVYINGPMAGAINSDINGKSLVTGWNPTDISYNQVGDLLFLVNKTGLFPPLVFCYNLTLGKYALTTLEGYGFGGPFRADPWKSNPFGQINALNDGTAITSPATTTAGTDQTFTAYSPYFLASMTGKYLRLVNGTTIDMIVKLKTFIDSQNFICTILRTGTASFTYGNITNASSFWQISDWGGDTGWPRTATSFQGRLIFGGNKTKPDTIWGSRISNIFDVQEVPDVNTTGVSGYASAAFTSDNSRPFTLTPNTPQSSNIVALSSAKTLNIHTDTAEVVAYGANGALGPLNVVFDSSSSFGGSSVQPSRVNNFSTYVQANGYRIRDIVYNFSEDQYKSQDLSFMADHYFIRTGTADIDTSPSGVIAQKLFPVDDIQDIVRCEARSSILYVKTRSGKLFCVTLDRDYQVNAWSRIVLGGEPSATAPYDNAPKVMSISLDPVTNHLVMLVERTFNGVPTVCFETLLDSWEFRAAGYSAPGFYTGAATPATYLDCAYACEPQYMEATPTKKWCIDSIVTGTTSNKYAGATVSVIADGRYVGEVTLPLTNGGDFLLDVAASQVTIGYKYIGRIKTSRIHQGGQTGTPVGRIARVDELCVHMVNSIGTKIGLTEGTLEEIPIRKNSTPMDQPTEYFTGQKVVAVPLGYERGPQVIIQQDKPYPLFITCVTARGVTYD